METGGYFSESGDSGSVGGRDGGDGRLWSMYIVHYQLIIVEKWSQMTYDRLQIELQSSSTCKVFMLWSWG